MFIYINMHKKATEDSKSKGSTPFPLSNFIWNVEHNSGSISVAESRTPNI
jgi:hypothetical protein